MKKEEFFRALGIDGKEFVVTIGKRFAVRNGVSVSPNLTDGTSISTFVRGTGAFTPPLGTPYGEIPKQRSAGILRDVGSEDDVPQGTKVFTENEAP